MVQSIVGGEPQLQSLARLAETPGAVELAVEAERRQAGNGVHAGVSVLAGGRRGEGSLVKVRIISAGDARAGSLRAKAGADGGRPRGAEVAAQHGGMRPTGSRGEGGIQRPTGEEPGLPSPIAPQAMHSHRRGHYGLDREAVPLVGARQPALGAKIVDVLHHRSAAAARKSGGVVDGFGKRVEHHRRDAARHAAGEADLPGVVNGIAGVGLVDETGGIGDGTLQPGEGIRRKLIGVLDDIKARSLDADVFQLHDQIVRQGLRDCDGPILRVRRQIVLVDGVRIGHRARRGHGSIGTLRRHDETALQREPVAGLHQREAVDQAGGGGKLRLAGQVARHVGISRAAIANAVAAADHAAVLLGRPPGESDTRGKFTRVAVHQRGGELAGERTVENGTARASGRGADFGGHGSRAHRAGQRHAGIDIERGHLAVQFAIRRKILPTQAEVQGEPATHAPVVLRKEVGGPAPVIKIGIVHAQGCGLWIAQQKVCEIVARLGEHLSVGVVTAGQQAAETELAARIRVRQRILLHPPVT